MSGGFFDYFSPDGEYEYQEHVEDAERCYVDSKMYLRDEMVLDDDRYVHHKNVSEYLSILKSEGFTVEEIKEAEWNLEKQLNEKHLS